MATAQIGREPKPVEDFLSGGGEMGARIRAFDWSRTPLGPIGKWPERLRASIFTCLNSQLPMAIGWGPDLTLLYNDATIPMLGTRHPHRALGKSYRECFPEDSAEGLLLVLDQSDHRLQDTRDDRYRTFFESIDEGLCVIE